METTNAKDPIGETSTPRQGPLDSVSISGGLGGFAPGAGGSVTFTGGVVGSSPRTPGDAYASIERLRSMRLRDQELAYQAEMASLKRLEKIQTAVIVASFTMIVISFVLKVAALVL